MLILTPDFEAIVDIRISVKRTRLDPRAALIELRNSLSRDLIEAKQEDVDRIGKAILRVADAIDQYPDADRGKQASRAARAARAARRRTRWSAEKGRWTPC
ncbi:hypothetical protein [Phyllobacterium sp. P5_D12]